MNVVCGIIENKSGLVLLAQRPPGKHLAGLWEFPGGKVEAGEEVADALARELKEELQLDIRVDRRLGVFPHSYDWGTITLHALVVMALNEPRATEDVQVFQWLKPREIDVQGLAPADVAPLAKYISGLRD